MFPSANSGTAAPSGGPRYLAPFRPQQVRHFFCDVLVIGTGPAGLRAALEIHPPRSVLIVTKGELYRRETGPDRTGDDHDPSADCGLAAHGGEWSDMGDLSRDPKLLQAVARRVEQTGNIVIWKHTFAVDILTHAGECRGALAWSRRHGQTLIWAQQTILAAGGAGQLFRETTNPETATGDGVAMAYRAGAEVRDLEFLRFHPTVVHVAGGSRHLLTKGVFGEGAYLIDRDGHRFMPDYDERGELAPQDTVSRAIAAHLEVTQHPSVYLDLSRLDPRRVQMQFPEIAALCAQFGLDITRYRMPVRPGVDYLLGGVAVDASGRTTLPRLWATGEVASTYTLDGDNSTSHAGDSELVSCVHVGRAVAEEVACRVTTLCALPLENRPVPPRAEPLDLVDLRDALKNIMWQACALRRGADELTPAAERVGQWCRQLEACQFVHPAGWELQNMLLVASLMIDAAFLRTETRDGHVRLDYPQRDDEHWRRHITYQAGGCRLHESASEPVGQDATTTLSAPGHEPSIILEFAGGYWDGRSLCTDSEDLEESLLARACYEMAHRGAIGAQCSGMSDEAVLFARLHGWARAKEAGLHGDHCYRVAERRETEREIVVKFRLVSPLSARDCTDVAGEDGVG